MLLAGISLLSYRRRTALLWKVEGSSLFLCFFLQTIIKTVDSNVQLYFHIFIYCHFFIGEINLEISKRFKRLLYAILQYIIRQVEILSNKLLATAFEASLGCMAVTSYAKRRQQGNRDSYRAPKSHNSECRLCCLRGRQNTGLS